MINWQQIRATLLLGWPIILGNLSQMALGVIDMAMVGAIHSSQLAAASFVNNLINIPLIICTGLATAISPLVAAALGEKDRDKPLRILFNGALVVGVLALIMALIMHFGNGMTYYFGQDEIVARLAGPYLSWVGWSMLPMALFMAAKQFADGLGKTRLPMYLALAIIPINILVNYAFIYGKWGAPRMELEGAGIGTLASRTIILIGMVLMIIKHPQFEPYRQNWLNQLTLRTDRMREIIRIGIPASLQYSMETWAFVVTGIMVGWLGYIQQAAHQIAISLSALAFMVSIGISAAGSIRVAYAFGQKDWGKVKSIGRNTTFLAILYGLSCAVLFMLARHQLPLLFNDEPEVLRFATVLIVMSAVFQISDSVQAVGVGLLRGVQDVNIPTLFVFLAYWVIGIPLGYWLTFHQGWDVKGLWVGFIAGLSASALLLSLRFFRISNSVP
jgi:MATE family multidrug resistance protein